MPSNAILCHHFSNLFLLFVDCYSYSLKCLMGMLVILQVSVGICRSQQDGTVQNGNSSATHRLEFGSLQSNKVHSKSFSVKNPFSVDVVVESVQPSCGCTVPTLRSNSIGAGDNFEGEVSLTASEFSGHIAKQIVFTCRCDTQVYEFILQILGDVHNVLEIKADSKWPIYGTGSKNNDYRFQIRNYFTPGHFPVVSVGNARVKEIQEINVPESLLKDGVVSAWEVVLSKPQSWKRLAGFANIVELKVEQEVLDGSVQKANSNLLIKTARPFGFRPRVLNLSEEEDLCSCEVFVREEKEEVLTITAIGLDHSEPLPIMNQRKEGNFFKFEISRSEWRRILEQADRIQVSIGQEENFWEFSK